MIAVFAWAFVVAASGPRLMVMPPRAPDPVGAPLARSLSNAIESLDRFQIVDSTERDALIARARDAGLTCDSREADCAARIGAFGGVDLVVVTHVEEADPSFLTVALHECTEGRQVRTFSAPLAVDTQRASEGVARLAHAAVGESVALTGTLRVDAVDGPPVRVSVDGAMRGEAPLTLEIAAGIHEVVLRRDGAQPETRVARVAVADVFVMSPTVVAQAPGPSPLVIASAVVAGVGVVVSLAAGGAAWAVAPTVADRPEMTARAYNDALTQGRTLLAVSALGGVTALGAGAALIVASVVDE